MPYQVPIDFLGDDILRPVFNFLFLNDFNLEKSFKSSVSGAPKEKIKSLQKEKNLFLKIPQFLMFATLA